MLVGEGFFQVQHDRPTGWFHLAMVFHGPNEGEGITVYHDGVQVASDTTKWPYSFPPYRPGDGTFVIGRFYTDRGEDYSSVEVDELTLWNRNLTQQEIGVSGQLSSQH